MSINPKILEKLKVYTGNNESLKQFLLSLLVFESNEPGHYKEEYKKKIEKYYNEERDNYEN